MLGWLPPHRKPLPSETSQIGETGPVVRILTNNGGDRGFHGLPAIAEEHAVDFVALQEAYRTQLKLASEFPGYSFHREDELVLLSRWPVIESSTVYLDRGDRRLPCAGRFVVQLASRHIVLYVVHMPTPRFFFEEALRNPTILLGIGNPRHVPLVGFWREKRAMTRELASLISAENLPVLVVSDFNMTPGGKLYPQFTGSARLLDFHRVAGSGFGMTFPFDREGAFGLLQPWVRIDYVFGSNDWRPLRLDVLREDNEPRQHLPVLATARLTDE